MIKKSLICSFVLFLMFALNCQALETKKEVKFDNTFKNSCKLTNTQDEGSNIKITASCAHYYVVNNRFMGDEGAHKIKTENVAIHIPKKHIKDNHSVKYCSDMRFEKLKYNKIGDGCYNHKPSPKNYKHA